MGLLHWDVQNVSDTNTGREELIRTSLRYNSCRLGTMLSLLFMVTSSPLSSPPGLERTHGPSKASTSQRA